MLDRISTHQRPSVHRTGTSAIAGGLLLLVSTFVEYLFSAEHDGNVTRRRRMFGWSAGVGLLLALTAATGASAGGPPVVQEKTAVVNELEITTDVHPCTGQPAQWTITNNGTIHFTAFADGTVHFTGLLHLTLVIDLLDPLTGLPDGTPDATGTATDAFGGNGALNEDGSAFAKGEDSFALNGRGTNADGSRFNFHLSGHHLFDSAGNLKLDLFRAHCA